MLYTNTTGAWCDEYFYIFISLYIFPRVNLRVYRSFSSDVTAAILVYQNNEMAAILVYGTGISSFLFKYFVLFHHPTGATDHVSENDLFPKDLRRRTATRTKFGAHFWRRLIANIDLAQQFGAE